MDTNQHHQLKRWGAGVAVTLAAVALLLLGSVEGASASVAAQGSSSAQAVSLAAQQKQQAAATAFTKARFGIPTVTSSNWSGYVDTNYVTKGLFNHVTAQWNVPEVAPSDCTHGTFATGEGLAGFWIGLDGAGDKTVEQTGTATECYKGTAYYWDWYEMYPKAPVLIGSINPGDHMTASVSSTSAGYVLKINDTTSGVGKNVTLGCPKGSSCLNHSAEAIAEAPSGCVSGPGQTCRGSLYLLPDYQWVSFHGISVSTKSATGGMGASMFSPENITMVNTSSIKLAYVSSAISGNAFTDTWGASG
jgi:hypothetical protein